MPKTAKKLKQIKQIAPKLKPTDVLAYLRAHPAFFEQHKDQLASLSVPKKSGNILSLHALKADKVSRRADQLETRQHQLISAAKSNSMVAESIFSAVLGLVASTNMASLRKYLQTGFAEQLELNAVRLVTVSVHPSPTTFTEDEITALCPQPVCLLPVDAGQHRSLFGPKTNTMKSACLMQLTDSQGHLLGLLALGSNDATRFHAGQATTLAEFLRRVTGTVLGNVHG